MSAPYTPIDLSQLPPPQVVEELDYEAILSSMLSNLRLLFPALTAEVESEPVYKILEEMAYRILLGRQQINDGARSVMLAYATGADLEHLAALLGVQRQTIRAGDPEARPPVPPLYESDDRLRQRAQLALEGLSTAGPAASYEFHARRADPRVKDISVSSPAPGQVRVVVLSITGTGTPEADLIVAVRDALDDERVRPLCDSVLVEGAEVIPYTVAATLDLDDPPDRELVRSTAEDSARAYADRSHRLGAEVTQSGLYAALHVGGVRRVNLSDPTADVTTTAAQAPYGESLTVEVSS